jgi:hypothetical protein
MQISEIEDCFHLLKQAIIKLDKSNEMGYPDSLSNRVFKRLPSIRESMALLLQEFVCFSDKGEKIEELQQLMLHILPSDCLRLPQV